MIQPPDPEQGWLDGVRGILLGLALVALGAAIGALLALAQNALQQLQ